MPMRRLRGNAFPSKLAPALLSLLAVAAASAGTLTASGCGSGVANILPLSFNERSVFLGDSITAMWPLPIHNAGVSGQTTAQIAARFETDVVASGLHQVIILAGANDVRVDHPDYAGILASMQQMVDAGHAAGIMVILCELTPITCCDTQVQTLNASIKNLATAQNLTLVDYYTPLAGQYTEYLRDGLHPNAAGYQVMEDTLTVTLGATAPAH